MVLCVTFITITGCARPGFRLKCTLGFVELVLLMLATIFGLCKFIIKYVLMLYFLIFGGALSKEGCLGMGVG